MKELFCSGGITHCSLRWGLSAFFLEPSRPCCGSVCSRMPSSTLCFASNRSVQPTCPLGGSEQASWINRASFAPSKIGSTGGVARFLRLKTPSTPSSTYCRLTCSHVFVEVPKASAICASVQPDPPLETSAFNKIRAFSCCQAALFPLRSRSFRCFFSSFASLTIYRFSLIFVSIAQGCDRIESLLPLFLVNTSH